jgi:hypothetical protein
MAIDALLAVLTGVLAWTVLPVAQRIGWPVIAGAVSRFGIIHVIETLARKLWLSPALRLYDWHSPDSWKWFVASLVASNVSLGAGYVITSVAQKVLRQ